MEIEFIKKQHRSPKTEFKKGHKHSKKTLKKISNSLKGNIPWSKGKKFNSKHRLKLSESHKGKKHTKEHKRRIGLANKGKKRTEEMKRKYSSCKIGIKQSEESKRKIGLASKKRIRSEEEKKKMSIRMKGNNFGFKKGMISYNRGKHPSMETRKKMRLSMIAYIKKNCKGLHPMIGHNEKQLLDEFEAEYGYEVIRQYQVEGYFLDGYVRELNLAIEVDEKPKDKERDIERQKIIEKKLKCKFFRIKDY